MSDLPKSTKRRQLIKRFRELGWTGPHKGRGPHPEFMQRGDRTQSLPNKHTKSRTDIGEGLLKQILEQAGIDHNEWLDRKEADGDDADTSDAEPGSADGD